MEALSKLMRNDCVSPIGGFTSGDHWDSKWERLKSWNTVQNTIQSILTSHNAEYDEETTISHGLKLLKTVAHAENVRSLTYFQGMTSLIFITNSGSDLRSFMNVWSLQGLGTISVSRKKFPTVAKCTQLKYIPSLKQLVACSPDQKLKILTARGYELIDEITTPSSVFCIEWNPDTEEILCGGSHGFYVYKINEDFKLVECDHIVIPMKRMSWCTRIFLNLKHKQFMAVCDDNIFVYNYERRKCTHVLQNQHSLPLSCCAYFEGRDFFMTAAKDGSIKIWNGLAFTLVTDLAGHSDVVTDMQVHKTEPLLFSSSLDCTVKVWRLDTFEMVIRFNVGEKVRGLRFLSTHELFVWGDREIKTFKINIIYQFYAPVYSTVTNIARSTCHGYPSSLVCSSSDGVVKIFTSLRADTYTTIFPQNSFQVLNKVVFIKRTSEVLAVLDSGNVIVYDASTNPCRPTHVLEANIKHDEQIHCISVIKRDRALGEAETTGCENLVFAGHRNGEISLLHSAKSRLVDRCRAHLTPVDMLQTSEGKINGRKEVEGPIGGSDRLVSCGRDMKIKVWALVFEEVDTSLCSLVCLKAIDATNFGAPLKVSMCGSTVAAALPTKSGVSVLVMFWLSDATVETLSPMAGLKKMSMSGAASSGIYSITHSKSYDHREDIIGLACHALHDIFITSSSDRSLKVWDRQNNLLRELAFEHTLSDCCFADTKGTIVIGYQNHLSSISVESYLPMSMLEKVVQQDIKDEDEEAALPYQSNIEQVDESKLRKEPAIVNRSRNMRMSRDYKSGWLGANWKIQYNANSSYTIAVSAESIYDAKVDRNSSTNRAVWARLGMSPRMAFRLSATPSHRVTSPHGSSRDSLESEPDLGIQAKKRRTCSDDYPLPTTVYNVEPVKRFTKAMFNSGVITLSKKKNDIIKEEREQDLEVARRRVERRKGSTNQMSYTIAPDAEIPNSIYRDSGHQTPVITLEFQDIALLIAKLPGMKGSEKSIIEYLMKRYKTASRRRCGGGGAALSVVPTNSTEDFGSYIHQLMHDWRMDKMLRVHIPINSLPVVPRRGAGNVLSSEDEMPGLNMICGIQSTSSSKGSRSTKRRMLPNKYSTNRSFTETEKYGLEVLKKSLLKEICREPWWDRDDVGSVTECTSLIIKLIPQAEGENLTSLLNYVAEIRMLFELPESMLDRLASAIIANMNNQKSNEAAYLTTMDTIAELEFRDEKLVREFVRIRRNDKRTAVRYSATAHVKQFATESDIDMSKIEELAIINESDSHESQELAQADETDMLDQQMESSDQTSTTEETGSDEKTEHSLNAQSMLHSSDDKTSDWSKNTKLKTIFSRKLKHGKGDATQRIRRKSKEAKDLGGVTEETELLHGTTLDDRVSLREVSQFGDHALITREPFVETLAKPQRLLPPLPPESKIRSLAVKIRAVVAFKRQNKRSLAARATSSVNLILSVSDVSDRSTQPYNKIHEDSSSLIHSHGSLGLLQADESQSDEDEAHILCYQDSEISCKLSDNTLRQHDNALNLMQGLQFALAEMEERKTELTALSHGMGMISSSLNERPALSMEPSSLNKKLTPNRDYTNDYTELPSSDFVNQADGLPVNVRNLALLDDIVAVQHGNVSTQQAKTYVKQLTRKIWDDSEVDLASKSETYIMKAETTGVKTSKSEDAIVFGPRMNAQLYRSAVRLTGTQSTGDAGVMDSDMAQKAELVRKTNQTDWLSADYSAIAQTAANLEIRGSGVSVSSGQAVESSLDCIRGSAIFTETENQSSSSLGHDTFPVHESALLQSRFDKSAASESAELRSRIERNPPRYVSKKVNSVVLSLDEKKTATITLKEAAQVIIEKGRDKTAASSMGQLHQSTKAKQVGFKNKFAKPMTHGRISSMPTFTVPPENLRTHKLADQSRTTPQSIADPQQDMSVTEEASEYAQADNVTKRKQAVEVKSRPAKAEHRHSTTTTSHGVHSSKLSGHLIKDMKKSDSSLAAMAHIRRSIASLAGFSKSNSPQDASLQENTEDTAKKEVRFKQHRKGNITSALHHVIMKKAARADAGPASGGRIGHLGKRAERRHQTPSGNTQTDTAIEVANDLPLDSSMHTPSTTGAKTENDGSAGTSDKTEEGEQVPAEKLRSSLSRPDKIMYASEFGAEGSTSDEAGVGQHMGLNGKTTLSSDHIEPSISDSANQADQSPVKLGNQTSLQDKEPDHWRSMANMLRAMEALKKSSDSKVKKHDSSLPRTLTKQTASTPHSITKHQAPGEKKLMKYVSAPPVLPPISENTQKLPATTLHPPAKKSMVHITSLEKTASKSRGGLPSTSLDININFQRNKGLQRRKNSQRIKELSTKVPERPSPVFKPKGEGISQDLHIYREKLKKIKKERDDARQQLSLKPSKRPVAMMKLMNTLMTISDHSEHHVELGKAKPVLKLNSETEQGRHELPSRYSKLPTIGTQSSLSPKPVKQQTMSADRTFDMSGVRHLSTKLSTHRKLRSTLSDTVIPSHRRSSRRPGFVSTLSPLRMSLSHSYTDISRQFISASYKKDRELNQSGEVISLKDGDAMEGDSLETHLIGLSDVTVADLMQNLWGDKALDRSEVVQPSDYTQKLVPTQEEVAPRPCMARVMGGSEFQWDSPLPPAPGSKLSLSHMKDMHNKYCETWRAERTTMRSHIQPKKEECSPNLPGNQVVGDSLRERHRLYPSNTDLIRKQVESQYIPHENWYPIYNYPSTFNVQCPSKLSTANLLDAEYKDKDTEDLNS